MNKQLLELNKTHVKNKNGLRSQMISESINDAYDFNEQLAIIFNALELVVDEMDECSHKRELQELLKFRSKVKKESK